MLAFMIIITLGDQVAAFGLLGVAGQGDAGLRLQHASLHTARKGLNALNRGRH